MLGTVLSMFIHGFTESSQPPLEVVYLHLSDEKPETQSLIQGPLFVQGSLAEELIHQLVG